MKTKSWMLFVLFSCAAFMSWSQGSTQTNIPMGDTNTVNSLLQKSKASLGTSNDTAILLAEEARKLSEKINFLKGRSLAYKNIGLANYLIGKYKEAIQAFQESLNIFEQLNDQTGIANILNNMAAIYGEQGNEEKGLEFGLRSLTISEKLNNKLRILSALNTIASIYYNKEATKSKALEYLLRALPLCEDIGDSLAMGTISENIGEIYQEKDSFAKAITYFEKSIKALGNSPNSAFAYNGIGKVYLKQGKYADALRYHTRGLQIAEDLQSKPNIIRSLNGLADTYFKQGDYGTALKNYMQASNMAEEIKTKPDLKDLYLGLARTYSKVGDYKNAFKYQTLLSDIKDTLYNIETDKKLGRLQFESDLEKKEGEIKLLTKDNDLQNAKIKRQQFAKNAFLVGLCLVVIIALLIFRNYLVKVRTHKILDKQKNEIEGLLLNILPKDVAHELQTSGHATPKQYESVSVMFTDFQAFTVIADNMKPEELVAELDNCFIAFDAIIGKYNLEKIKTIGDSYMCAGGLADSGPDHVLDMVNAGLEIQKFVAHHNSNRTKSGLKPWEIRIGVHVGPVIAGVVGKKKYAYDIWGSTVNIASRMESNGQPGKVNISRAVYDIVKDDYECSYRGKVSAKNVGDIDMYFIEDKSNGKMNLNKEKEFEAA